MDVVSKIDNLPPYHLVFSSSASGWLKLSIDGSDKDFAVVLVQVIDRETKEQVTIDSDEPITQEWFADHPHYGVKLNLVCTAIMYDKNKPLVSHITQQMREKLNGQIRASQPVLATASVIQAIRERESVGQQVISPVERTAAIAQFDRITQAAIDKSASDIHYEIRQSHASVYFRIDGNLRKHMDLGTKEARAIVYSVYNTQVESGSTRDDLNERKMQNAVIDRQYSVGQVRLRFGSMPVSPNGLDVVLRILLTGVEQKHLSFLELGYEKSQASDIARAFGRASGVTIIAGTTGSGKSTTLKNAIEGLIKEHPAKKFRTLEDPVEYRIAGASQTSIIRDDKDSDNSKPFTDALKACLRTDPDFIMIGEVRDKTTAIMALQAAQTGHQVATTLHTESWSGILNRLAVMGLDYPTIGQPGLLSGLIYQKLLPVLCPHCKIPLASVEETEENHGVIKRIRSSLSENEIKMVSFVGKGCPACSMNGTKGRTICAETAVMTSKILRHVTEGDIYGAIGEWRSARNEFDMRGRRAEEHAVSKMIQGGVSPIDVEAGFRYIDEIIQEGNE
jgi:type II secretory ATPase GspE/PulE/Tfp pilus assembly ATPase PilB-like protein